MLTYFKFKSRYFYRYSLIDKVKEVMLQQVSRCYGQQVQRIYLDQNLRLINNVINENEEKELLNYFNEIFFRKKYEG